MSQIDGCEAKMGTERPRLRIAVIGLGEVGSVFAAALQKAGADVIATGLRRSERATRAAGSLGLKMDLTPEVAVAKADIILLAVVGDVLLNAVAALAPMVKSNALFVDLTTACPSEVVSAASQFPEGNYIDAAICGAVSIHGSATPLLAAGPRAAELQAALGPMGLNIQARPDWKVGDASKLKLVRSVFTKGLELILIEALLSAEIMEIRPALQESLLDYDQRSIREHADMYLRTHLSMAERRLEEMRKVKALLEHEGAPTTVASATINRYCRTLDLMDGSSPSTGRPEDDFDWLFSAETKSCT